MLEQAAPLPSLTVPGLLRLRAAERPEALALSAATAGGGRRRLTYAALVACMEAMARGLARLGFGPGDRLAILLNNEAGHEAIVTSLGALALGAAVAPVNTRYADEELAHALDLVAPAAVVAHAAAGERLARLRPGLRRLLLGEAWPDPGAEPAAAQPPEPEEPDRLGCLLFTSGTTARSKAVMHSHATMLGTGLCCGRALELGPADRYQVAVPFFTSSALNLACQSAWVAGAALIYEGALDNAGRLRLIAEEGTTFYHGVPSVLHFMLQEDERGGYDLTGLRRVGYGGAPMPPEVAERIDRQWPWVEQVQIFGLTESGPSGSVLPPEERARHPGSIGRAMPGCRLSVLDEAGDRLPVGTTGEIAVEGPAVALGYFRNPEATAAAFQGRRVRTGDVGYLDPEGYLYFTDRKKDVINRGGLKVASVAVESVLYRHPGVREAAVVAVPHPALGEDVAACVVARDGVSLDPAELAAFCAPHLADYERPRRWLLLEALPKNPMGKVLKGELRALAAAAVTQGRAED